MEVEDIEAMILDEENHRVGLRSVAHVLFFPNDIEVVGVATPLPGLPIQQNVFEIAREQALLNARNLARHGVLEKMNALEVVADELKNFGYEVETSPESDAIWIRRFGHPMVYLTGLEVADARNLRELVMRRLGRPGFPASSDSADQSRAAASPHTPPEKP